MLSSLRRTRRIAAALAVSAAVLPAAAAAVSPRVAVTIKPVHSLVAGIMGDIGEPALLLHGAASPHTYTMRPSDSRRLGEANLVIWVGEALETFFARTARVLAQRVNVVALMDAEGLSLLGARHAGAFAVAGPDADDHAHGHRYDPHFWLDPTNGQVIVKVVARSLAEQDPDNAGRYEANAASLVLALERLDAERELRTAPVRSIPYVVLHDAYQYFERRYRLNAVGALSVGTDRAIGARRVTEIRAAIASSGAVCVFVEPQFEPRLVHTALAGTGVSIGVLDPLGGEIPAGPSAYFTLLRRLADALVGCLSDPSAAGPRQHG